MIEWHEVGSRTISTQNAIDLFSIAVKHIGCLRVICSQLTSQPTLLFHSLQFPTKPTVTDRGSRQARALVENRTQQSEASVESRKMVLTRGFLSQVTHVTVECNIKHLLIALDELIHFLAIKATAERAYLLGSLIRSLLDYGPYAFLPGHDFLPSPSLCGSA